MGGVKSNRCSLHIVLFKLQMQRLIVNLLTLVLVWSIETCAMFRPASTGLEGRKFSKCAHVSQFCSKVSKFTRNFVFNNIVHKCKDVFRKSISTIENPFINLYYYRRAVLKVGQISSHAVAIRQ